MLKIDGGYGLGSGQLTRSALIFSTLTRTPIEIYDIRKGRPKPGLKMQHLHAVKALEKLANAKSEGVELYSKKIRFYPGELKGRTISIDIGTAGSITLLIQNLLLPMMFADGKVRLKITGGTDVTWSPSIDWLNNVLFPVIKDYCKKIDLKIIKRGYFPKGNGRIDLTITPKHSLSEDFSEFLNLIRKNKRIELIEQGKVLKIEGLSHASEELEKADVAERQAKAAKLVLKKNFNCPIKISAEYCDTLGAGSGITLWATTDNSRLGADNLGKPGKRSEIVGEEAALKLVNEIKSGAAVDKHLADNLIPFLSLFLGRIKTSEITGHVKTNIWVCEQFLPVKFKISDTMISCVSKV